jgi:hypothetical protein
VLPQAIARGNIHNGIMAGKLKGVMPAHTPSGWRNETRSTPVPTSSRGTVGVASKVFGAIQKNNVNVAMITQGSSELNLAFVVKNSDSNVAVQALHDAFELDKIN